MRMTPTERTANTWRREACAPQRSLCYSLRLTSTPERAAGFGAGVLAVFNHLHTIDENMLHARCILVRFFKGRVVLNCRRIKHDHVGEHSFLQHAPMVELEIVRR